MQLETTVNSAMVVHSPHHPKTEGSSPVSVTKVVTVVKQCKFSIFSFDDIYSKKNFLKLGAINGRVLAISSKG